jgi:alpha-ketoglutaric semialdehyde dehydrogenase
MKGLSLVEGGVAVRTEDGFRALNPANGDRLEPVFHTAGTEDLERATAAAEAAFAVYGKASGAARAGLLRRIADGLAASGEEIVARANLETGLPLGRLQGELGRTTGQLRMFADVVEEGSWVDARIDEAMPERKPLARADLRSMLRPLGPVAVFGASNFPLAFSVAGGDTASALAAGCPVIVKAHPAHPGTSELVGDVIVKAVKECGLPAGVFSLLFDAGTEVGAALVVDSRVKAVGFTGSSRGGMALMRLAAGRPEPIPVYAEMGSSNPMFILPGALRERGATLAKGLFGSFTLGSGQFCTKPGVVFVPEDSEEFGAELKAAVGDGARFGMLTPGIAKSYAEGVRKRAGLTGAAVVAQEETAAAVGNCAVFEVSLREFVGEPTLAEEIFGPTTLLVRYGGAAELLQAARGLEGHLTATIHASAEDHELAGELLPVLEGKVGRVLFNGYPTGVEVCPAMVHGGPWPATSDGRSTSVGTRAIFRFARAICWQDCPDELLPAELQRANPLKLMRMVNGVIGRD